MCFVLVRGWRNPQLYALTKQIVRLPLQSSDCVFMSVCLEDVTIADADQCEPKPCSHQ